MTPQPCNENGDKIIITITVAMAKPGPLRHNKRRTGRSLGCKERHEDVMDEDLSFGSKIGRGFPDHS